MNAIEFDSSIENGMIRVPDQYKNVIGSIVKVIVFPLGEGNLVSTEEKMESIKALSGIIPDDFDLDAMRAERILGKQT
ncbi:MAG: hypothetical protein FWG09_04585 [Synergistaceae bacterium]|nr:hypothetical protein [Synergistaceae bacterium]